MHIATVVALFYSPYREEKQHIGDIMAAFAPYFKVCLRANESLCVNLTVECQNVS